MLIMFIALYLKILGIKEDAQDIVQNRFEKLWINREQIDNDRSKSIPVYSSISPDDRPYKENKKE